MTHPPHRLAGLVTALVDPTRHQPSPAAAGPAPAGLYLGQGRHGPVLAGPEHHALVLGPPRAGKTTRILVPNLCRHPGPAVVTSTKRDVLAATITTRSRLGTCWYWDPSGTTIPPPGVRPLAWSPTLGCEVWDHAVARAHILAAAARPDRSAGEAHWVERAEALLAPLLHAAALADGDLATVLSWLHRR